MYKSKTQEIVKKAIREDEGIQQLLNAYGLGGVSNSVNSGSTIPPPDEMFVKIKEVENTMKSKLMEINRTLNKIQVIIEPMP
jgi:hypothetical protein